VSAYIDEDASEALMHMNSTITLLFQDECGGLEVEDPKNPGSFLSAPPVKDALIMNVGDLLMRWSNGS
jgi:isopenicillin N synthase-like dioxygenase